jgi:hypothetical protein
MNEADEPLRKVTLNLYRADVEWLEKKFGFGWTEQVRLAVRRLRQSYKDQGASNGK